MVYSLHDVLKDERRTKRIIVQIFRHKVANYQGIGN